MANKSIFVRGKRTATASATLKKVRTCEPNGSTLSTAGGGHPIEERGVELTRSYDPRRHFDCDGWWMM